MVFASGAECGPLDCARERQGRTSHSSSSISPVEGASRYEATQSASTTTLLATYEQDRETCSSYGRGKERQVTREKERRRERERKIIPLRCLFERKRGGRREEETSSDIHPACRRRRLDRPHRPLQSAPVSLAPTRCC